MKKIYFVIPSLGGGGAERVLVHLLRGLDSRKFDVNVVLFKKEGIYLDDVPGTVAIHSVDHVLRSRLWYGFGWLFLLSKLGRLLRSQKPEIIVSFMWYSNFVVLMLRAMRLIRSAVIVSERYTLSFSYEGKVTELIRSNVVRFVYPFADKIVAVSEAMSKELNRLYNIPPTKISVIYNPVDFKKIEEASEERVDHPWFRDSIPVLIAAGRLSPQKGFSYLIRAVSILKNESLIRLIILGEGDERKNLQQLIDRLGLQNQVELIGFQKNPYKYFSRATIFVLSSLYEGFPNALVEAMVLGVPCIATRCPTGPEEIIMDGVNGLLVPTADEKVLAEAIIRLLKDPALRKQLAEGGRKRAEDFRVEKIVKEYEDLILSV